MKAFLEEFKKFALRGNVMDMAVGIIVGAAKRKRKQTLLPRNVRFVKAKLQSRLRDVPTVHHTLKKRSRYEPV